MKSAKLLICMLTAILLGSCNLTEEPYGIYSKQNIFSTPEGAQSVLLSSYRAYCNWEYMNMIYIINDYTSDVAYNNRMDDVPFPEFTEWNIPLLQSNQWNMMHFKTYYRSINSACDIIENLPEANFNEDEKNRILGEAYFLRGYAYYQLATIYGKVPMKFSTTDLAPQLATSIDQVWEKVISDLKAAESLMPIKRSPGCADRVAAWSALAKVYLFIASAKNYNVPGYEQSTYNAQECYAEAALWAGKVVDNPDQKEYYLDPDLHNVYDVDVQNGPEQIFLIAHNRSGSTVEGDYSKTPRYFLPSLGGTFYVLNSKTGQYEMTLDGWSCCVPTQKLIDDMRSASAADKRLDFFKSEYYTKNPDGTFNRVSMLPQDATHYVYTIKHFDPHSNGTEMTSCPTYMIRFADILLVYAEALGKDQGLQWLNKLTARSGGKTYQAAAFADDAAFRSAVLEERKFELCFEGKRLEDLRRTRSIRAKVQGKICYGRDATDLSAYTDEQLTYYPLPLRESELNPNL